MNIPCCNLPSLCQDPADPITNFSSEAPDENVFYGWNYGQGLVPPLGSNWTSSHCRGSCTSTISQADADACAQRANIECLDDEWPDPDGNRYATFQNDAQSCDFTCPDGSVFTYTVPAGTYSAFSQAGADAIAYSDACNKAIDFRICIGDLTPASCCIDSTYSGTVSFDGPVQDYTATIVSGNLPPGIGFVQDEQTGVFQGTPTTAGTFSVVLNVEDAAGNFMQKTITIKVVEISLSGNTGSVGSSFSEALSTNLGSLGSQTYSIVSGALPTGLTLGPFPASAILGTPTTAGSFTFTVQVVDSSL